MFQLLDDALEDLLHFADPGNAGPPPLPNATVVSFKRPDKVVDFNGLTLSLFLYGVRENRTLRDPVPILEFLNGRWQRRRPPVRVDCDYLVTAWHPEQAGEQAVADEHKLLADALLKLSYYPAIPTSIVLARLPGQPFPVDLWVAQEDDGTSLAEFWGSLGISPRASFRVVATLALVHAVTEDAGPPVTTKKLVLDDDLDTTTPGRPFYSFGGNVRAVINGQLEPVEKATVTLDGVREVETNEDGHYLFGGVAAGSHTVDAVKGAASASITVTIPPDLNAVPAPALTDFDLQL